MKAMHQSRGSLTWAGSGQTDNEMKAMHHSRGSLAQDRQTMR